MTAAALLPTTGLLAAEDGPHIALSPEAIFQVGGLTVTNSMIYGVLCAVLLILILLGVRRKVHLKAAKGFSQLIEILVEFIIGLIQAPLGSRAKAVQYAPIFGTFFVFIIFNNLMGLLPIVGPGVYAETAAGQTALFRPFTADLNGTIALAAICRLVTLTYESSPLLAQ